MQAAAVPSLAWMGWGTCDRAWVAGLLMISVYTDTDSCCYPLILPLTPSYPLTWPCDIPPLPTPIPSPVPVPLTQPLPHAPYLNPAPAPALGLQHPVLQPLPPAP